MSSMPMPSNTPSSRSSSRANGRERQSCKLDPLGGKALGAQPRPGAKRDGAQSKGPRNQEHAGMAAMTTAVSVTFELDGELVEAAPGETIWQVAQRHGTKIPHLCWHPAPGYRADGNCRACMVEIEG